MQDNPFPYTDCEVRDIHGEVCVFAYTDKGLLKQVRLDVETVAYLIECAQTVQQIRDAEALKSNTSGARLMGAPTTPPKE